MAAARDVLLCGWTVMVVVACYAALPAVALGRWVERGWWVEIVGGAAWSTLVTTVTVPLLARARLLNWATSLLVVAAWPVVLWMYRARGAPLGEFRALCRRATLRLMTWRGPSLAIPRLPAWGIVAAALTVLTFVPALRELRLASPAEYAVLARARVLLDGGGGTFGPLSAVTAVVSRVAAVDPMLVVRCLHPLLLVACALAVGLLLRLVAGGDAVMLTPLAAVALAANVPALVERPAAIFAWFWTFAASAAAIAMAVPRGSHRRDRWHVAAAALVAMAALPLARTAGDASAPLEYDAAARVAVRIARTEPAGTWTIAAPPEQAIEIGARGRVVDLAAFVRRYDARAGLHEFRFAEPTRNLFVFVEKQPLAVRADADAATSAVVYRMPNARAKVMRAAFDLCERYRRAHPRSAIYYDDDELRVYQFRR